MRVAIALHEEEQNERREVVVHGRCDVERHRREDDRELERAQLRCERRGGEQQRRAKRELERVQRAQLHQLLRERQPSPWWDRPIEHEGQLQPHAILREPLAVERQLLRELAPRLGTHDEQARRDTREERRGEGACKGQGPGRQPVGTHAAVAGCGNEAERVERWEDLQERCKPERNAGGARSRALRRADRDEQQRQIGEAQDRAAHQGELIREAGEEEDRRDQHRARAEGAPDEREGKQLEGDVDERQAEQEAVARRPALEQRRAERREERRLVVAVVDEPGSAVRTLRQLLKELEIAHELRLSLGSKARGAVGAPYGRASRNAAQRAVQIADEHDVAVAAVMLRVEEERALVDAEVAELRGVLRSEPGVLDVPRLHELAGMPAEQEVVGRAHDPHETEKRQGAPRGGVVGGCGEGRRRGARAALPAAGERGQACEAHRRRDEHLDVRGAEHKLHACFRRRHPVASRRSAQHITRRRRFGALFASRSGVASGGRPGRAARGAPPRRRRTRACHPGSWPSGTAPARTRPAGGRERARGDRAPAYGDGERQRLRP